MAGFFRIFAGNGIFVHLKSTVFMPYGLTDREWCKLLGVFAGNKRIRQAILYGSRAKGTYKPFSDVDITLVGEDLSRADLNRLLFAIDDLLLPYQVDLSLFHVLKNDALVEHIRRKGIVIYENIPDAPSKEAL